MTKPVDVYLECGTKRTFAGALDWPGWCRQGRSEAEALAALLDFGPRYATVLRGTRLGFVPPKDVRQLVVVERLPGTVTTDFGAPGVIPTADRERSCGSADLDRFEKILRAIWRAFDQAVKSARGKTLATGPRGGGRSLEGIVDHVIGADGGYVVAAGWKAPKVARPAERLAATRGRSSRRFRPPPPERFRPGGRAAAFGGRPDTSFGGWRGTSWPTCGRSKDGSPAAAIRVPDR